MASKHFNSNEFLGYHRMFSVMAEIRGFFLADYCSRLPPAAGTYATVSTTLLFFAKLSIFSRLLAGLGNIFCVGAALWTLLREHTACTSSLYGADHISSLNRKNGFQRAVRYGHPVLFSRLGVTDDCPVHCRENRLLCKCGQ